MLCVIFFLLLLHEVFSAGLVGLVDAVVLMCTCIFDLSCFAGLMGQWKSGAKQITGFRKR